MFRIIHFFLGLQVAPIGTIREDALIGAYFTASIST